MMKEPEINVGIVNAQEIHFSLNGRFFAKGETVCGEQSVSFSEGGILWNGNLYRELTFTPQDERTSFSLYDVTIGINFHWERQETQSFMGTLKLVVDEGKITAINILPVEDYLISVISSEMNATSSLEFLKAHAVVSRSWLFAQMEKRKALCNKNEGFFSFVKTENEYIRWYDREDHTIFDVCADDHCQRYQGLTRQTSPAVEAAVDATRGMVLTYGDEICDARFSKCCGGRSETFGNCWEDASHPYLEAVDDPFCDTTDTEILDQVLNGYDREAPDFYRWEVTYTPAELSGLIARRSGIDFGDIEELRPLTRGQSGRIVRLLVRGSRRTMVVGKELEIRRWLSESHLRSSNFEVTRDADGRFILRGRGWGHGVGLCQIGVAVMGAKGYSAREILHHYFPKSTLTKIYE